MDKKQTRGMLTEEGLRFVENNLEKLKFEKDNRPVWLCKTEYYLVLAYNTNEKAELP